MFEDLWKAGRQAGEVGLGLEIVQQLRRTHYIPGSALQVFAAVLEREYASYLAQKETGAMPHRSNYGTWRGYPREYIPWFPTVNVDLCDGCGVCLRLCASQALAATSDGKVRVVDPMACVVGCSSCANVCKPGAITFPPRSLLDAYKPR